MTSVDLIRSIDSVGQISNVNALFKTAESIMSILETDSVQKGLPHTTSIFGMKSLSQDYCLKRLLMGCAVSDNNIQRNFLTLLKLFVKSYKELIDPKYILEFIKHLLSSSSSVSNREKRTFIVAKIRIYILLLISYQDEKFSEIRNSIIAEFITLLKGNNISKFILAIIIASSSSEMSLIALQLYPQVIPVLSKMSYVDMFLGIAIKNDFKNISNESNQQLLNYLKEYLSPKSLLKIFDNFHKDENFKKTLNWTLFFKTLAGWFISSKDLKITTLLHLSKLISKSKDKLEEKSLLPGRVICLIRFINYFLSGVESIDDIVKNADKLKLREDFKLMMILILEQKNFRNKDVTSAFNELEKTILEKLTDKKSSKLTRSILLDLLLSVDHISKLPFKFRDSIFDLSDQSEKSESILEELEKLLNEAVLVSLNQFKNKLQIFVSFLSSQSNSNLLLKGYKILFGYYKNAEKFVEKMENDLSQHTSEYLCRELRNFLFDRLFHLILRPSHQSLLFQIVNAWLTINKEEDVYENLKIGKQLLEEKESFALIGILNIVVVFRDYMGNNENLESIVFNQTAEDLSLFGIKLINNKNDISHEDLEILTDIIITLMNVSSGTLRKLLNLTFAEFVPKMNTGCLEQVVKTIFKDTNDQQDDEQDSEEKSEEENKKDKNSNTMDESDEYSSDEEEIEIKGDFI